MALHQHANTRSGNEYRGTNISRQRKHHPLPQWYKVLSEARCWLTHHGKNTGTAGSSVLQTDAFSTHF